MAVRVANVNLREVWTTHLPVIQLLEIVFVSKMSWAKGATIAKLVISTLMLTTNLDVRNASVLATRLIASSVVDMSKVGLIPKAC